MSKSSAIVDLIERLEMKMEAGLVTPELLENIQRKLDSLDVMGDEHAGKQYQYALELQTLIYREQGKNEEAKECLARAVGVAGSPKKLRSLTLKNFAKRQSVAAVSPTQRTLTSSVSDISTLSERDQKFMQKLGLEGAPDVEFFVRKPSIFVLLLLITTGGYAFYWFYKNWRAVRDASALQMRPFWRAVFSIFYVWPLFRIMIIQAQLRGFQKKYPAGWLALGYIVPSFFSVTVPRSSSYTKLQIIVVDIVVFLCTLLILVTLQRAAVFNNRHLVHKTTGYSARGKYEAVLVLLLVLSVVWSYALILRAPSGELGGTFGKQVEIGKAKVRMQQLDAEYKQCSAIAKQASTKVDPNNQEQVRQLQSYNEACQIVHQEQKQATNRYNQLVDAK
jgi:hypothetical protein